MHISQYIRMASQWTAHTLMSSASSRALSHNQGMAQHTAVAICLHSLTVDH